MKYTPENGSVCICAYEEGTTWSIEVKDTGIGIPSCEQKKLFRNYFRGSNVVNLKVTGSGIGLMLVYKLVRLHKGKIQIQSAEQQGTCVRITFLKGNKHFHKAKFISPKEVDECPEVTMSGEAPDLPVMKSPQMNNSSQRVLVVEDNDDLRNYLVDMLAVSYYVQSCSNGKDALVIIREFNPDLVISDIMMPEMSGDELCSTIKSDIEMSHIPVILLTALGDEKIYSEDWKSEQMLISPNLLVWEYLRLLLKTYLRIVHCSVKFIIVLKMKRRIYQLIALIPWIGNL